MLAVASRCGEYYVMREEGGFYKLKLSTQAVCDRLTFFRLAYLPYFIWCDLFQFERVVLCSAAMCLSWYAFKVTAELTKLKAKLARAVDFSLYYQLVRAR